ALRRAAEGEVSLSWGIRARQESLGGTADRQGTRQRTVPGKVACLQRGSCAGCAPPRRENKKNDPETAWRPKPVETPDRCPAADSEWKQCCHRNRYEQRQDALLSDPDP